jgi:hypothetical protein
VRYYRHEAQEGFGRLRSEVMATGMRATPYVRMRCEVRAALASAHYWDVDMTNCQPRLLQQRLQQYSIPCPLLSRYVSRRGQSIEEVAAGCGVPACDAKRLFLRLMFYGSVQGWLGAHPEARADGVPGWVYGLQREMRESASRLLGLDLPFMRELRSAYSRRNVALSPQPPDGAPDAAERDSTASMMALYLQTLECECVTVTV